MIDFNREGSPIVTCLCVCVLTASTVTKDLGYEFDSNLFKRWSRFDVCLVYNLQPLVSQPKSIGGPGGAPRNCDLIWRARAAIRQLACKAKANRTGTCFNCTGEQNVQGYLRGSKKHLKKLTVSTAQWKKSFWKQLLRSLSLVERNNDTLLTVHHGAKAPTQD